jgi:hypothetical protein
MEMGLSESHFAWFYCYNATDTNQNSPTSLEQGVDFEFWVNFIQVDFLILDQNCQDTGFLLEVVFKSFID